MRALTQPVIKLSCSAGREHPTLTRCSTCVCFLHAAPRFSATSGAKASKGFLMISWCVPVHAHVSLSVSALILSVLMSGFVIQLIGQAKDQPSVSKQCQCPCQQLQHSCAICSSTLPHTKSCLMSSGFVTAHAVAHGPVQKCKANNEDAARSHTHQLFHAGTWQRYRQPL